MVVYRDPHGAPSGCPTCPTTSTSAISTPPDTRRSPVLLHADDTTPVPSKSEKIRYALEAPAGWFAAQNLTPGAQLAISAAGGAVSSPRGFRAQDFVDGK